MSRESVAEDVSSTSVVGGSSADDQRCCPGKYVHDTLLQQWYLSVSLICFVGCKYHWLGIQFQ